jgi:hypothetical protein
MEVEPMRSWLNFLIGWLMMAALSAVMLLALAPAMSGAKRQLAVVEPTSCNQPWVPTPTAAITDQQLDARWLASNQYVESPEDGMVVDAGWHLYPSYQAGWSTNIIAALPATTGWTARYATSSSSSGTAHTSALWRPSSTQRLASGT